LLITGNGPHTRDQVISGSPMFGMIADHLARRGLAVLRTDARGYGASTGPPDWEQYTTADRVEDNRAILAFLRRQPGIDPDRIVLAGHSEGAMIAAALAASGELPALSVLLSPSALPGNEVFAMQRADNLRRLGASDETAEAVHRELVRFADLLAHDRGNRPRFDAIALAFLAAHGVPPAELDPKRAQGLLEGYLKAPWYWHFVALDPREDLARIRTPVWAVFGGADETVPWRAHLPALTEALTHGGPADFSLAVLPDQDHFFLEFEGRRMEKHVSGRMEIADELFAALDAELERRGLLEQVCRAGTQPR
jgi:pimeloyl-ACP methyl ester carboxylesterase